MLISDKNINNIRELVKELKEYIANQKDYVKLELTEKLSIIMSTILLAIVLILLGVVILFYLSFSLVHLLEPYVGGLVNSYAIVAGFLLLLGGIIYLLRKKIFVEPIVNFMAKLFLNDSENEEQP